MRLSACLGANDFNTRLLAQLDDMLSEGVLPDLGSLHGPHHVPDHGFAPEPVFLINTLAWTGDNRLVPRLRRVVKKLHIDPETSDHRFAYIHAVAYAAELLGTPDAGALALRLMERPEIRDRLLIEGEADPRETVDFVAERFAYLGLCLARGAARCGLIEGYFRLVEFLGEIRLYLARSARRELVDLLATDHGYSHPEWMATIEARRSAGNVKQKPYRNVIS